MTETVKPEAPKKMTRPTGVWSLCERLVETGTSREDLQPLYDLLPKDRYGNWTGKDRPVQVALDLLEQIFEEDDEKIENGDILIRRIQPLTFEKAKAIAKRGRWEIEGTRFVAKIDDPLPDEEVDPNKLDDEEDETPKKKRKKRSIAA
jgi:hypothetical protein